MKEVSELISNALEARLRITELVADWNREQAAFKPGSDDWSANEVLEHLFIQEFFLIIRVWKALDGLKCGKPIWVGEPVNRGRSIGEFAGCIVGGKYKAPPIIEPRFGGPLSFWIEALQSSHPRLQRLESLLQDMDLEAIIFPHFLLGPLDARQWLEFLPVHMGRHRAQIERLRCNERFPD